jgi:KDO2-lipid IV(A) lauroyltransferase
LDRAPAFADVLEAGIAWHGSQQRIDGLFQPTQGEEHFEAAKAQQKGVIVLTLHLGCWELLPLTLSRHVDGVALYKAGEDPDLDRRLAETRERFGLRMVPAGRRGIRALFDSLNQHKTVLLLPDQEPKEGDGRFVPLFGVPALTGVLVPRLLQRTGARVVFEVAVRRPGNRCQVVFLPADEEIYSPDIQTSLAALNRGVEQCIALDPAQYLWGYKRFRARPDDQPRFY